jgi:2-succinyl-5-enolpyruvyl-6-hydroxy-3-cyclohexene-1-carboxylate synthase
VSAQRAQNRAHAFAAALFEEFRRSGVEHVCVSPGSRSTPLAVAAVQQPGLRDWSHLDERSAGFFALGLAKATRKPVALVCTSGTAATNFHPAVVEAHHARVPLLLLTADRPPELRDWGAGQTIDQQRLYGAAVRWFAELPVPEAGDAALRYGRSLACRAVAAARGRPAGPVHLNLPFREPLHPVPTPGDEPTRLSPLAADGRDDGPYTRAEAGAASAAPDLVEALAERLQATRRGVVVCGPLDEAPGGAESIAGLAEALGWPLLAEPTAQLRRGPAAQAATLVTGFDLFLRHQATAERLAPEFVLRFGDTPTSKSLRLWLEHRPPRELVVVDPDAVWHDPSHLASRVLRVEPAALCDALARRLPAPAGSTSAPASAEGARSEATSTSAPASAEGARSEAKPSEVENWLAAFRDAGRRTAAALDRSLDADGELLAPRAVRELGAALPEGALLYVSNSMAVRDLDAFLPPGPSPLRVLCNRGANGIDGGVSSALGAAAGAREPVVHLTGDLAFLHDAGGLLAAHRHGLRATLVVLDDDGGGIFSFLPVAAYGEAVGFEEHFRTPHGLDLAAVARGYGAAATRVGSPEHLGTALKEALAADRVSVIVVPVDRERNVEQHRAVERAVFAALDQAPR